MVQLSPLEKAHLSALFEPHDLVEAERMLGEECCDVTSPLSDGKADGKLNGKAVLLERVRVAVLKMSSGDLKKLRAAVDLANADWRDVLVVAGFADDLTAHERWVPRRSDGHHLPPA